MKDTYDTSHSLLSPLREGRVLLVRGPFDCHIVISLCSIAATLVCIDIDDRKDIPLSNFSSFKVLYTLTFLILLREKVCTTF